MGDPLRDPGQIQYAEQDQHQAHGQLHGEAEPRRNHNVEENDRRTDTKIVIVWPMPHRTPMMPACPMLRWRLTIVETAITWSGSVAWRMPRRNPRPITASRLEVVA